MLKLDELVRAIRKARIDTHIVQAGLKRIERRRAIKKHPSPFGFAGKDFVVKSDSPLETELKTFLMKKFHNLVLAWRLGLDADGSGRLSFFEFQRTMAAFNYKTNFKKLWADMDDDGSGTVSLVELDPEASASLREVRDFLNDRYECLEEAWATLDTDGSLRLTKKELAEGLERINFSGNANTLFSYLYTGGGAGFVTLEDFAFLGLPRDPKFDMTKVKRESKRRDPDFEPLRISSKTSPEDVEKMPGGAMFASAWADFYKTNNKPETAVMYAEEALRMSPDSKHLQTERHSLLGQIARRSKEAPAPPSRRNSKLIPFVLESRSNPPPPRPKKKE